MPVALADDEFSQSTMGGQNLSNWRSQFATVPQWQAPMPAVGPVQPSYAD